MIDFANVTEWRIPEGDVLRVTRNSIVLWEKETVPDYTEPFYVQNISNANETLNIRKISSSAPTLTIEYSTDKATWNTFGTTSTTALTRTLQPGDKIYLRCTTNKWANNTYRNAIYGISKIGGNIMSLLYGSNFTGQETSFPTTNGYEFYRIFNTGSSLNKPVNASKLLLPAITLNAYCYFGLFAGCTSLTAGPVLPATTLADSCYNSMFYGCTSLTTAPALPATIIDTYCYANMFYGCTSLTTAPALPATTMTRYCYYRMFYGCTLLTTAPALPATTLDAYCYYDMFSGCTSLTTASELSATTLASGCYWSMFSGCTSLTSAPELPATTLKSNCYYNMFYNCTSLTTAPALPATTLAGSCYNYMFSGCTSLNEVKCLATTNISSDNTMGWLHNVSSTGTFTKAAGVTWPTGDSGIPSGWTVVEQ